MKKPLKLKIVIAAVFLSAATCSVAASAARAQGNESLTFSITPPLFKVNMQRGESWSSTVKVNNNNSYATTIYVQAMDFRPAGETGGVEFIESTADSGNDSLSSWLEISKEPFLVAPNTSIDIAFTIKLPLGADPGGHYAAILAGNKPLEAPAGNAIKFSSKLASLILLRVSGDVIERGNIREFTSTKKINTDTSAGFTVRFANGGNVHLQPQGQITVYNMFGKVRGILPINQKTDYGNVLPGSEKKWTFDWQGTSSLLDAGRMKADLVFSFGEEARQSDFRTIYFWTVDWKPTLAVLGGLLFLVLALVFSTRRYIRKSLEAVRLQAGLSSNVQGKTGNGDLAGRLMEKATPGTNKSIINLRVAPETFGAAANKENKYMNWSFFKIVMVLILTVVLAAGGIFAYKYFAENRFQGPAAGTESGQNEGAENSPADTGGGTGENAGALPGGLKVLEAATSTASTTPADAATTSQAVVAPVATTSANEVSQSPVIDKKEIGITVKNGSGIAGAASKLASQLESEGYNRASLGNADNFNYLTTEIIYGKALETEARSIDKLLGSGNLLSEDPNFEKAIIIIIGKNYK